MKIGFYYIISQRTEEVEEDLEQDRKIHLMWARANLPVPLKAEGEEGLATSAAGP